MMNDSSDEECEETSISQNISISEEERSQCLQASEESKASGNACFSAGDYKEALKQYSLAVSFLKKTGARDAIMYVPLSLLHFFIYTFICLKALPIDLRPISRLRDMFLPTTMLC